MRVILYARVSTAEQANDGVSLEAQVSKMKAYSGVYDLEVIEVIVDPGESAKTLKRTGLQRALELLRSGDAEGLVIAKLDRLTRNVGDWQRLIDSYFGEKAGKQLFSVADSIDTRTAAGRLVLNVLLSVAQWEREATAERTRDALQHKIKRGERVGKLRFGYDLAEDGKTLVPNEDEQQAIELMKSLRETGATYRAIAVTLTENGIPAKDGGAWDHTSVRWIIRRKAA